MRRKETACEVAHCSVPVEGVTARPSSGAPEGAGGVVLRERGVGVDVAGDVDGVGSGAEADDLRVEADGDVEVVVAGEEEEGVAAAAELGVFLFGVDLVDLGLHLGGGRRRREDEDVGAEERLEILLCLRLCLGRDTRRPRDGRHCESEDER